MAAAPGPVPAERSVFFLEQAASTMVLARAAASFKLIRLFMSVLPVFFVILKRPSHPLHPAAASLGPPGPVKKSNFLPQLSFGDQAGSEPKPWIGTRCSL